METPTTSKRRVRFASRLLAAFALALPIAGWSACASLPLECDDDCNELDAERSRRQTCIKRVETTSTCGDGYRSWSFVCIDLPEECEGHGTEIDSSLYCETWTRVVAWREDLTCYDWNAVHLLEVKKVSPSSGATCNLSGTSANCDSCVDQCCDDLAECLVIPECVELLNCLTDCPRNNLDCARACEANGGRGRWDGGQFIDCVAACSCGW